MRPNGHAAEWTCIATRAASRYARWAQIASPLAALWFGFPSSAWARQIYLLPVRERSSQTRTARRGQRSDRPALPDDEWVTDRGLRCVYLGRNACSFSLGQQPSGLRDASRSRVENTRPRGGGSAGRQRYREVAALSFSTGLDCLRFPLPGKRLALQCMSFSSLFLPAVSFSSGRRIIGPAE
jgi:hypothetical protein